MENVPSKPSAARVIFFGSGKFLLAWVNYCFFFFSMLYQAVRGEIILGWVTLPGYVTLPSLGKFTQTDVFYPAWVWLPSLGTVTQAG